LWQRLRTGLIFAGEARDTRQDIDCTVKAERSMKQTRPRKRQADRYARKIAAALTKGRIPTQDAELEDFIHGDGALVFETLEGFVESATSQGDCDSPLVHGYLFLLQGQLQNLRFQRDRRYDVAIGMIENFQRTVADHARAGHLSGPALSLVMSTLHQAGIEVSPDLKATIAVTIETPPEALGTADLIGLLDSIVEGCAGDAFQIASSLAEAGHGMPAEIRANLAAGLAASPSATARESAVLMLLDPEPSIRQAVIAAFTSRPASLSPVSVRRLIAMRNWRPESERTQIDDIVRAARAKGIECAAIKPGKVDAILARGVDGAGAQSGLVVSRTERRKSLSSILFKHGLREAWTAPPQTERELGGILAQTADDIVLLTVSRGYLDRIVCHNIQVGLDVGMLPPTGLLQVAEILGADWHPNRLNWHEALAALLKAVPATQLEPGAVAKTLKSSDEWAVVPRLTDAWFEDDQDVTRLIGAAPRRNARKQADFVLQSVIERRRNRWAELFLWISLWLREAAPEDKAPWQEFAILADAIAKGRDLDEIPLMHLIAISTVMALTEGI
jgi:hypothetical protein